MQVGGGGGTEEEDFAADRQLEKPAGDPASKRRRLEVEAPDLGDTDDDEVVCLFCYNIESYSSMYCYAHQCINCYVCGSAHPQMLVPKLPGSAGHGSWFPKKTSWHDSKLRQSCLATTTTWILDSHTEG